MKMNMNKKLIAIAAGAALALPMAVSAEVTVYGMAQAEIASFDIDGAAPGEDGISVVDNARGRIGVKASEDLGNGLTGIAKFEFKADTADGVAGSNHSDGDGATIKSDVALTPRESFVGLKGSWGQVELGRLKSEYKYSGGVKYDPFVATTLEARGNGGMSSGSLGHNSFLTDSIAYRVKAGIAKLGLTYDPSENQGKMSAAAKFGGKNWEAFLAVIDAGDGGSASPASSYSSTKVGGQFKFADMHTISAQFESTDPDTGGAEPTFVFLGYQLKMGKNNIVVQYGANDADGGTDKDYFTLGLIHKFTKTTRAFTGIRSTSPDSAVSSDETVISFGMRQDF